MDNFANALSVLSWTDILEINDAELAFNSFWDSFSTLFDLHFPEETFNFNKNVHKIQGFMSNGLLISCIQKNNLHKLSLIDPSDMNVRIYKQYRKTYNNFIRASKKLYFETKLSEIKRILK